MARNSVLDGFQYRPRYGCDPARLRLSMVLGSILALGTGWAPDARGSGIFRNLTAKDRSQPILLSQVGEVISLRSPGHPGAGLSSGAVPAYLAFPLYGGEHIPAGTPTVATGPQPAAGAVGPLALTPAVQKPLNADLLASRGAIVDAPSGSYAVAILPRYARALAQAASPTGRNSGSTAVTSILGMNPNANWVINGIPSNKLSQWFKTGTKEISHLTSLGVNGVSKTLGLKVTPTSNGYHIAAEEMVLPTVAKPAAATSTVATPEPGGWLVFGLILGAAGLRRRFGR